MDEPGTYDNSNSNTNTNAVSMPAATADTQEQHFIQYIFFGSTDVHKLYTPESVDNNSTNEHREKNTRSDCAPALAVMSCDDFKRAICKANNFNACVAPRLKLYKYPTQTSPTEYKRAESICQGTTVLIALGGEGGASSALQEILPLLVVPAPCSFSPQPPLPTQSEFNPKHFPLPGIDPSLDPALLRASREGKAYPTGALSVVTDCPVLRGLLSAGVEDFRVRREAGLVGVMRAVAAVTQNPDNTSVFAALPQLLTLTTEAFDCLSAAYLQVSQEQQQQTSSALNGTVVGNGVGYCLQTLVNLTRVQYFWCNRSKASAIHTKACPEVVSAIQSGRAPETIAGFIESLEQMVRNKKDTHKQQLSVLVLAIEALGAITYESLPVLTRLGCRKSFLDALVRVQRADPNGSHAEDKQLEFRMHQAAFTFLVVGARGSPAFSKEAADAGALDAIVDTLLWAVEAFYKGEAENEELNPVCDREDYFLEAVPQTLRGNASATPLGSFMGILNDALTGGTTYSQWLMEGLLTALFDAERPGECAQNARTIYTKFPELQYQFVVCLCILATPVPCSKPTCDALGSESGSEFDRKDGGSSSNDGSIVSTNSNDSEENGCSSDGSPSNPMNLFLCDKKLWNILFSECFMRIGSEEKDGTVRLSARKYFVVLRQKICEFAVRLSGVPEVRLATLNNILQEFHEVQCVEVRVICVEIMASIFAKYANDPAVIADAGFIVPSVCIPLTILSEKAAQIQDELRSSPALKSILERYKSSRSATIASIVTALTLTQLFVNTFCCYSFFFFFS